MEALVEPLSDAGYVLVGPIVAVDGITLLAAANIADADIKISKNNAAFAARFGVTPPSALKSEDGFYIVALGVDDLPAIGHIVVKVAVAGHLIALKKYATAYNP